MTKLLLVILIFVFCLGIVQVYADEQNTGSELFIDNSLIELSEIPEIPTMPDIIGISQENSILGTGNVTDRVEVNDSAGNIAYINLTIVGSNDTSWDYTFLQSNQTNSLITAMMLSVENGVELQVEGLSINSEDKGTLTYISSDSMIEKNPVCGYFLLLHGVIDGIPLIWFDVMDINGEFLMNEVGISDNFNSLVGQEDLLYYLNTDNDFDTPNEDINGSSGISVSRKKENSSVNLGDKFSANLIEDKYQYSVFYFESFGPLLGSISGYVNSDDEYSSVNCQVNVEEAENTYSGINAVKFKKDDTNVLEEDISSSHYLFECQDETIHYYGLTDEEEIHAVSEVSLAETEYFMESSFGMVDNSDNGDNLLRTRERNFVAGVTGWEGYSDGQILNSKVTQLGKKTGEGTYIFRDSRVESENFDGSSAVMSNLTTTVDEGYTNSITGYSSLYASPVMGNTAAIHGSWFLEGPQGFDLTRWVEAERNGETIYQTESSSSGSLRVYDDASSDMKGVHIS